MLKLCNIFIGQLIIAETISLSLKSVITEKVYFSKNLEYLNFVLIFFYYSLSTISSSKDCLSKSSWFCLSFTYGCLIGQYKKNPLIHIYTIYCILWVWDISFSLSRIYIFKMSESLYFQSCIRCCDIYFFILACKKHNKYREKHILLL